MDSGATLIPSTNIYRRTHTQPYEQHRHSAAIVVNQNSGTKFCHINVTAVQVLTIYYNGRFATYALPSNSFHSCSFASVHSTHPLIHAWITYLPFLVCLLIPSLSLILTIIFLSFFSHLLSSFICSLFRSWIRTFLLSASFSLFTSRFFFYIPLFSFSFLLSFPLLFILLSLRFICFFEFFCLSVLLPNSSPYPVHTYSVRKITYF